MTMRIREERRGSDLEDKNMNSYAALIHFDNTSDDEQGQKYCVRSNLFN